MLCKMKVVLLLVLLLHDSLAIPTMEDNKLPTDQEVLGQPEEVASLGLPSDEESFNRLSVFFTPPKPSAPVASGTYHFVSSTFPVDARGFHESVFDGIGDYFPSWPAPYKRQDSLPYSPSLAQRLGLQPRSKFSKRSSPAGVRRKRAVQPENAKSNLDLMTKDHTNSTGDWYCTATHAGNGEPSSITRLGKRETHLEREIEEEDVDDNIESRHNYQPKDIIQKRSGSRWIRGMEMGSSGFHGDAFGDFGDFTTMRKRGFMGFHGDTFSDGFGDFATMKRALKKKRLLSKLKDYLTVLSGAGNPTRDVRNFVSPSNGNGNNYNIDDNNLEKMEKRKPEMTSSGFHGDTFSGGFGEFYPVKRRPEMDSSGFHGDTFSRGFGEFEPFKKRRSEMDSIGFQEGTFTKGFDESNPLKKRISSGSMGFHGDTFSQGFGDFDTLKKRRPEMDSTGFHGDTFSRGFGEFEPFKKRRPMGSMGFHGDTFSQGFGDFDTLKKRRPIGSMGFHGDTFSQGFGDFDTYKKRRPMGSMGFHGDTFSQGFGDFDTYKKRRPEMDSMGFHGDTFSRGFGEFEPFKKRRPEMDSMGFHGDTFNGEFGDVDVYKRTNSKLPTHGQSYSQNSEEMRTEDKNAINQRHQDGH